ncbi:hypothetical protein EDB19DRAFT_1736637 [Suillus lakei]|nr:hypothetical protein EDB19DRAFT_1753432 [Suillus lakei]KAG1731788.1 hypothetical protein EDB19DRAFT_1736637 [Suillus lakei]
MKYLARTLITCISLQIINCVIAEDAEREQNISERYNTQTRYLNHSGNVNLVSSPPAFLWIARQSRVLANIADICDALTFKSRCDSDTKFRGDDQFPWDRSESLAEMSEYHSPVVTILPAPPRSGPCPT